MSRAVDTLLPILRDGGNPVARQGERIISRATFLAEMEELAGLLPDRPFVVNFCLDRYRFSVALDGRHAPRAGHVAAKQSRRGGGDRVVRGLSSALCVDGR